MCCSSRDKTVCIIGAGAAGLCAARRCLAVGITNVTILEQCDALGGNWRIDGDLNGDKSSDENFDWRIHSSMYDGLITNLPKEIMPFSDLPFPHTNIRPQSQNENGDSSFEPTPSFISHEEMLAYLKEYSKPVRYLIRFNRRVVSVERLTVQHWSRDSLLSTQIEYYDALFVCSGRHTVPRMPPFAEKYQRSAVHSHLYRNARKYSGQTVCVIGGGPSGSDIALQLAEYAKKVYLSHKLPFEDNAFPPNCSVVPGVVDAEPNCLILSDGQRLIDLDTVIYCTGYKHSFPFLEPTKVLQTPGNGAYTSPLYQHCIHTKYWDSLFVTGLTFQIFPMFDHEIHLALAFMLHVITPETVGGLDKMKHWETDRLRQLAERKTQLKYLHRLCDPSVVSCDPWPHFEWIRQTITSNPKVNFPLNLKPIPAVAAKIYEHVHEQRRKDLQNYKTLRYIIIDDENFLVV
ncbi:flavin-binding monooxygenase-like domain-containing protein [Ditylenchus destructor]|nr:flavin-binding monooxygenase-like domain-containing protein [Ditylenchus destructor]